MKFCDEDIEFIKELFPAPYNTPETCGNYFLSKIQHHDTLCSAVIAEVKKSILPPLLKKYHYRFFCRIDACIGKKFPFALKHGKVAIDFQPQVPSLWFFLFNAKETKQL